MYPLAAVPFSPIVSPLGQDESALPVAPSPEAIASAKTIARWGMLGVFTASLFTAGVTAAAFAAHRRSGSIVLPALVSGVGSLAMGSTLLYVFAKANTQAVDPRVLIVVAGAQMAS